MKGEQNSRPENSHILNVCLHSGKEQKIGNTAKIIVITEKKTEHPDIIDNLLANPIRLKGFSPFLREEIYDRF